MRTVLKYKQVGFNKFKTIFITVMLLSASFMSGAMVEKIDPFMQDVYAVVPEVLFKVKNFFYEQMFIKMDAVTGYLKWGSALVLSIGRHNIVKLIRGP